MDPGLDPDKLKPVSLLPAAFQSVFPFRYFNAVQSESFAEVFLSDDNLVISSPTGSGKTVLFELCILRLLGKSLTTEGHFKHGSGSRKTVYIAPMKALVQDKLREWTKRFSSLGLKCQELTSDSGATSVLDMLDTDIILSTPEKFDVITRRHRDRGGMSIFGDIGLLLIDEVHLLSETRGAALEAVVSRLKMLARFPEIKGFPLSTIRFVAVSATVSNIEDLGEWLRAPKNGIKRFGEEYRPVRLTTTVFGYQAAKNDFLFERKLQHYLLDILMHHSGGRPSLVFCSTRKGAQETAVALAQYVSHRGNQNPFVKNMEHFDRLQVAAQGTNNVHMQLCIRSGVGFHNGGLAMEDRCLVEGLFLKGDLIVLCTTSTLAQGVNLPAHAVIIKSTQYYNQIKGCYVEYERSAILQMSGRAGRPQFDDSGVVIIMTRNESVHLYKNLLAGSEPVESQLLPTIVEHLNAEIVLMTVTDCGQAIDWLKCSYLYVRIKKNPQHYNVKKGISPEQLENKLKEICVQNVNELAKYGLVKTDEFGYVLTPLEPGRIMEKYYLQFETMKAIAKAPESCSMEELILVLAGAEELSWIKLRRDEKRRLNDINADMSGRIRYHVNTPNGKLKKRIQLDAEKIFVLVNDALSGEPSITDFTMNQDVNAICTTGTRICRCMSDYFIFMKRFRETRNALLLSKCLKQRLWENTRYQLKQLAGVGSVTAKALVTAALDSFEKLATADPRRLEAITGRKFPYGDQLKGCLDDLPPKVEMNLFESGREDQCLLTLHRVSQVKLSGKSFHSMGELVVGSKVDNTILFHERISMDQFASPYAVTITCSSAVDDLNVLVIAALISEEYVGVDVVCKLSLNGEAKDSEMRFHGGHGCQEVHTSRNFYISPFESSVGSINSPTVSKLQNQTKPSKFSPSLACIALDYSRAPQTAESETPVADVLRHYPPRNLIPSPVTLAIKETPKKLLTDIEASPTTDPFSRNPSNLDEQESDSSSDLQVLEVWPTPPFKFPSSKTGAGPNSPEFFNSCNHVNGSPCTSSLVPAEASEKSRCISPAVTPRLVPQREVPRNAPRRLSGALCTNNEGSQLKTGFGLMIDKGLKASPVIAQSEDASSNASMCIQEPCSSNYAGYAENSADGTKTSTSWNLYDTENLKGSAASLSHKSQVTMHDDTELQTKIESNMKHEGSGPSTAASAPPSSSSTSPPAASDFLSLDLRRKIRRTGFSRIPSFSPIDDKAQTKTMVTMNNITQTSEKEHHFTEGRARRQEIMCDWKVPVPSATKSVSVPSTLILKSFIEEIPDQRNLRRMPTESLSSGKRSETEPRPELDLKNLDSISNPFQQKYLWSSIKDRFSTKSDSGVAKEAAIEPNRFILHQASNNISTRDCSTKRPLHIDERLEIISRAQTRGPSCQVSPYKNLKIFDSGLIPKFVPTVASVVNTALKEPKPHNQEASFNDNWSYVSEAKRLKADNRQTIRVQEPSMYKNEFSCFKFDPAPIDVRSSTTAKPSPTSHQEFMGYKSLFSFL